MRSIQYCSWGYFRNLRWLRMQLPGCWPVYLCLPIYSQSWSSCIGCQFVSGLSLGCKHNLQSPVWSGGDIPDCLSQYNSLHCLCSSLSNCAWSSESPPCCHYHSPILVSLTDVVTVFRDYNNIKTVLKATNNRVDCLIKHIIIKTLSKVPGMGW